MTYYTYKITDNELKKSFIGFSESKSKPKDVLGVTFFGTSGNRFFNTRQKELKDTFSYEVIDTFKTEEKASEAFDKLLIDTKALHNPDYFNIFIGKPKEKSANKKAPEVEKKEDKPKEDKEKKSKSKTITCPHCGKTGKEGSLKRWHFDNCKKKED